jgi:hypothetical protein
MKPYLATALAITMAFNSGLMAQAMAPHGAGGGAYGSSTSSPQQATPPLARLGDIKKAKSCKIMDRTTENLINGVCGLKLGQKYNKVVSYQAFINPDNGYLIERYKIPNSKLWHEIESQLNEVENNDQVSDQSNDQNPATTQTGDYYKFYARESEARVRILNNYLIIGGAVIGVVTLGVVGHVIVKSISTPKKTAQPLNSMRDKGKQRQSEIRAQRKRGRRSSDDSDDSQQSGTSTNANDITNQYLLMQQLNERSRQTRSNYDGDGNTGRDEGGFRDFGQRADDTTISGTIEQSGSKSNERFTSVETTVVKDSVVSDDSSRWSSSVTADTPSDNTSSTPSDPGGGGGGGGGE